MLRWPGPRGGCGWGSRCRVLPGFNRSISVASAVPAGFCLDIKDQRHELVRVARDRRFGRKGPRGGARLDLRMKSDGCFLSGHRLALLALSGWSTAHARSNPSLGETGPAPVLLPGAGLTPFEQGILGEEPMSRLPWSEMKGRQSRAHLVAVVEVEQPAPGPQLQEVQQRSNVSFGHRIRWATTPRQS